MCGGGGGREKFPKRSKIEFHYQVSTLSSLIVALIKTFIVIIKLELHLIPLILQDHCFRKLCVPIMLVFELISFMSINILYKIDCHKRNTWILLFLFSLFKE